MFKVENSRFSEYHFERSREIIHEIQHSKFKVISTDKEKSHQPVNLIGMTDAISQSLKTLLRND